MAETLLDRLTLDGNIEKITNLCLEIGLAELYLYDPRVDASEISIAFVARKVTTEDDEGIDSFTLMDVERKIANILEIDSDKLSLLPENMIEDDFRELNLENAQPYTKNNKNNFCQCLDQITIDSETSSKIKKDVHLNRQSLWNASNSKRKREKNEENEDNQLTETESKKQKLLSYLEANKEIYALVVQNPELMNLAAQDIRSQNSDLSTPPKTKCS